LIYACSSSWYCCSLEDYIFFRIPSCSFCWKSGRCLSLPSDSSSELSSDSYSSSSWTVCYSVSSCGLTNLPNTPVLSMAISMVPLGISCLATRVLVRVMWSYDGRGTVGSVSSFELSSEPSSSESLSLSYSSSTSPIGAGTNFCSSWS